MNISNEKVMKICRSEKLTAELMKDNQKELEQLMKSNFLLAKVRELQKFKCQP
jgi:hypothetical protein